MGKRAEVLSSLLPLGAVATSSAAGCWLMLVIVGSGLRWRGRRVRAGVMAGSLGGGEQEGGFFAHGGPCGSSRMSVFDCEDERVIAI